MLIPIKHENMAARRWPVVTITLITINVLAFFFTMSAMDDEAPQLGEVKSHILILAATHPELKMKPEEQQLVDGFKKSHPEAWKHAQSPYRDIIDAYDARIKMMDDSSKLQEEMDSLNDQYVKLAKTSIAEQYAFVPAHPTAISYLTANFLHGGWLHIIGNMWALWIFGDNVEDRMGHVRFAVFYLLCGIAAGMVHLFTNPHSTIPTVGASGAIAGVMGAYFILFPRSRVIVLVPILIFPFFFEVPAVFYIGFWAFMQVFSGTLSLADARAVGGVAWWAHVGGFITGMVLRFFFIRHRRS